MQAALVADKFWGVYLELARILETKTRQNASTRYTKKRKETKLQPHHKRQDKQARQGKINKAR